MSERHPDAPAQPPDAGCVLVVDDDEWAAFTTQPALEALGYTVALASCGERALEMYRPGAFRCVLLDYRLPGMTGPTVLRGLRDRDPDVRVILLTGFPRDFLDPAVFAEGPVGFLGKPWTRPELLRQLAYVGAQPPPSPAEPAVTDR